MKVPNGMEEAESLIV